MKPLNTLSNKIDMLRRAARKVVADAQEDIRETGKVLGLKMDDKELLENAPCGSFEYLRQAVGEAFDKSGIITQGDYGYIQYMFPDKIIISSGNKYYMVPYVVNLDGSITFGDKVEVEQEYKVVESDKLWFKRKSSPENKELKDELKESGIEILSEGIESDTLDLADFISLKEGTYDDEKGEVEAILIEAGTNPHKKRHYPASTIKEAAQGFRGLKMYLNHPTRTEEKELPERDITKWASTIVESRYEDGKAIGTIAVHDKWLRERLKDPVARAHIGLSINAGGKVSTGKVDGQEMQIVEKIVMQRQNGPASVDWVTEAGARGRVSKLLKESINQGEEEMKTLKEAKIEDLQKENPELLAAITESVAKKLKENSTGDEALKEANAKIAEFERKEKLSAQKNLIGKWLKESKLPEIAKERINEELVETLFATEAELKESFDKKIKRELEYLNKISGKGKISLGASKGEGTLKESFEANLAERMGVTEEKDEEAEDQE